MNNQSLSLFRKTASLVVILAIGASLAFLSLGPWSLAVRPSQAAFPGSNGKIAFADAVGIKAIDPHGSDEEILVAGGSSPAWSPDGKQIAYVAPHNSGSGIYIADANGSDPEYITIGADPAWSPDGKKLVFLGGIGGLCIRDLATGVETQLTQFDPSIVDYHGMPAWQPGGNKIVFLRHWYSELPYEHYDIWLVNADGSGLSQLTDVGVAADDPDPGLDFEPSWSPDGLEILFMRSVADVGIYKMAAGGGPLTLLKSTPGSSPYPAWSPSGNKIAYISYNSVIQPPTYEIHVMDIDGTDDQTIISKTVMIVQLDWGISTVEHEFVVNSDNNVSDNDPGDGTCDTGDDVPGGDPECTLRAAIEESNALSGKDTITFDIPGSGVPLIKAPDGFDVTDPVVIDATTQPDSGKVEIDGGFTIEPQKSCHPESEACPDGFRISGGDSTVRGLVIHGYPGWAIVLTGGGGNVLEGNFIGTDASGTTALGNGSTYFHIPGGDPDFGFTGGGLLIESGGNRIGGTDHDDGVCNRACNLISGNTLLKLTPSMYLDFPRGMKISGPAATENTAYGNFIGTDVTGQQVPAGSVSQYYGISVKDGASSNVIGGNTPGMRNVISGNQVVNVSLVDGGYNTVRGNFTGTNATGAGIIVGNHGEGVGIYSDDNEVALNVISGNSDAIGLFGTRNHIHDNLIGTAADGVTGLGNILDGIILQASDNDIEANTIAFSFRGIWAIKATNNRIITNSIHHNEIGASITWDATGIEISNNSIHDNQVGVQVEQNASGIRISANSIHDNQSSSTEYSGLGIDLLPIGPNANDLGDSDEGPNGLLNFPVIGFAAITAGGDLRIGGSFDSILGSHPYRIEFFASAACDESGYGEGERFLGFADVTTDLAGRAVIDVTQPQNGVQPRQFVTATAIDEYGNTSEFSLCVEAQSGDSLAASAGVGSTMLQVVDSRNFMVGNYIRINPGGVNQEDNQVIGFGSLLLATPLQFAHAAGEPVVILSVRLYLPMIVR